MESAPVVIVGAGPSGLVLGLCLDNLKVKSIILEKETEITQDPRGVYLSGDSVRVLWSLGIQEEFAEIGHEHTSASFHRSSLTTPAFLTMDSGKDWRHQSVPDGIMQIQPELERVLRQKIQKSTYCEIRVGCEVVAVEEADDSMIVEYRMTDDNVHHLEGSWLVGADGKRGFVRKHYLEPVAGVQQEKGLFAYEGTWIAANFHIRVPTPETHPDFPAWEIGMTPQEVYDLFWPEGVHFITPPGKPTASMRFGPVDAHLWRHEFAEPDWNDTKDPVALTWEHVLPMLTRDQDGRGRKFPRTTFPKDCIEVRRCAPYTFSQKVVNKWFHNRTILVGDAAHVFPPFAGQGITAGIRDAQALAWRLAIFERVPSLEKQILDDMLNAWSHERKQSIDDSARITRTNGEMTNQEETWIHAFVRSIVTAIQKIPIMPHMQTAMEKAEEVAYRPVKNGFFSAEHQGGGKVAQIYLKQDGQQPFLSDLLLTHDTSLMTLLVFGDDKSCAEAGDLLAMMDFPQAVISKESIVQIDDGEHSRHACARAFRVCLVEQLDRVSLRRGYAPGAYRQRLGPGAAFAIVRSDFIVYASAKNLTELQKGLQNLRRRLGLINLSTTTKRAIGNAWYGSKGELPGTHRL